MFDLSGKKIWVAGHNGMVGQAVLRQLEHIPCDILTVSRQSLDLRDQTNVLDWMKNHKPAAIIMAAATAGGIEDNRTRPADFIYDNIAMATNIIHGAHRYGVQKLLYLGTSCIYPRDCTQPIVESALMTGPLEPTNEAYAIAKIAGIKLCQSYRRQYGCDFIAAMPCNLYGPGDRFDPIRSHVIPALIMKFKAARDAGQSSIAIWGTGRALREFLHVDDLARALVTMVQQYSDEGIVNIGSGHEISIHDLAHLIADEVGYQGEILFDTTMSDGTPRKVLDCSKIQSLGWSAQISLRDGIEDAVRWYEQSRQRQAA